MTKHLRNVLALLIYRLLNSLPSDITNIGTLHTFRKTLKTFTFCKHLSTLHFIVVFITHQHIAMRYWYSNSVCLSIHLSVCHVLVFYGNGLTYCHSFFTTPIVLVLWISNIFAKFGWDHPYSGVKYMWGPKMSRFSTNKSLYLANDTRQRHSY